MVYTRNKMVKEKRSKTLLDIIAIILENYMKMQHEIVEFKKRSAEQMDASRLENVKMRRVEPKGTVSKGKEKEIPDNMN